MKGIVAFVVFLMLPTKGNSASLSGSENLEWQTWMNLHGRSYNDGDEESFRKAVWMQNSKNIERNRKSDSGFTMATNNLADLNEAEYRRLILGKISRDKKAVMDGTAYIRLNNMTQLPENVDWRTKGCVTPVENQMEEGKSWAISAIGSLEGQYCIPRGRLVVLNEQKLFNCCSSCFSVDDAFRYMIAHNHIDFEGNYDTNCNFSAAAYGASLTGYVDIRRGSEYQLQFATAKVGPISVAIDASHQSFQLYSSGVYDEPSCSSTQLDHAVLVVGYGRLHGKDYWLVKNSWGSAWGMKGYIMMSRNKDNQCGIATSASYPTGVNGEKLVGQFSKA